MPEGAKLNFNENNISDLTHFKSENGINTLELRKNQISDLKGLLQAKIHYLYLAENQISSLKSLSDSGSLHMLPLLFSVTRLHLRGNKIESLADMPYFGTLKYFNLRDNLVPEFIDMDKLKG